MVGNLGSRGLTYPYIRISSGCLRQSYRTGTGCSQVSSGNSCFIQLAPVFISALPTTRKLTNRWSVSINVFKPISIVSCTLVRPNGAAGRSLLNFGTTPLLVPPWLDLHLKFSKAILHGILDWMWTLWRRFLVCSPGCRTVSSCRLWSSSTCSEPKLA